GAGARSRRSCPFLQAFGGVHGGERRPRLHALRECGQARPLGGRPRHVAGPAHQHHQVEVGHAWFGTEQAGAAAGQVRVDPFPGRLDPRPHVLARGVAVACTRHFMRIPPDPEQRLHRLRKVEHPLQAVAARRVAVRRHQPRLRMLLGQVQGDRGCLGHRPAVQHQGRDHAGGVERQVLRGFLLALVEVQLPQFVVDAQVDEQPVDEHAGGAGRVVEDGHGAKRYHRIRPSRPDPPMLRIALPCALACLFAGMLPAPPALAQAAESRPDLTTVAERSGFVRTGRYEEVIALCDAFARAWPEAVRCETFGTSPEGRPMKLLVVTRSGAFTPEAAAAKNLPVMLAQGGIHSGEIDGKDAGFLLLREMLEGRAAPGALDKLVFLFVPVFNVDGHENFRAWNRPNQRGPEEMGFRTTAQRFNLNRDYVKSDSAEMRAMLGLVQAWDPLVTLDLHVTDGAKFQHDISITGEPVNSGDPNLRVAGRALRDGIAERLTAQGFLPVTFYPSFVEDDNPASGFVDGVNTPRFSHGYFPLRNRIGILVETHSWRTYPERVRSTHDTVLDAIELTVANAARWQAAADAADRDAAALGGKPVALSYKATDKVRTIDFLGYAYTRTPSDVSGALMTHYDEGKPEIWKLPLRDEIVPDVEIVAPRAGY